MEHRLSGWMGGSAPANSPGLLPEANRGLRIRRKQHEQPGHAKHGRRLRPAARLFALAAANLAAYGPRHLALDVDAVRRLCAESAAAIIRGDELRNPWSPGSLPQLRPQLPPG